MIAICKKYLIEKLTAAGIKTNIHTSEKTLRTTKESHLGAVIVNGDAFVRSGSKKKYTNIAGDKQRRLKTHERTTTFRVVIGEYEDEKCEQIFEKFIESLETGIMINGNYTSIEIEDADWVDKEDSILSSKLAVQINIKFKGGIYVDQPLYKFGGEIEQTVEGGL